SQFGSGFTGYPADYYEVRTFNEDFYGGGVLAPNTYVFANMGMLQDQQGWANTMGASGLGFNTAGIGWDPICSNTGDRGGEVPGTCFTPAELVDVSEESLALYVQLNFGGAEAEIFGLPVSGNIGVRYVETTNDSSGGVVYPTINPQDLVCEPNVGLPGLPAPPVPFSVGCYLSQDDIAFMNGANAVRTSTTEYEHLLHSFNLKFELNDEWLLRLAASRAMARPDMGNLKNFVDVGATLPDESDANDPLWIKDANGEITGARVYYSGGAQNPFLAPVVADQYDVSLE